MVDRNGNIVNNYEYDEWGNILVSNESVSNPFKYAGEVFDEETGLYYLRARYYDPATGRFLSEDPFIDPSGLVEVDMFNYAETYESYTITYHDNSVVPVVSQLDIQLMLKAWKMSKKQNFPKTK